MIITICGSCKFKKEMLESYKHLTDAGHMVFLPAIDCSEHDKIFYKALHFSKIDKSDGIFVVDVNGYFGEDTKAEIDYANRKQKEVYYLSANKYMREQILSYNEP